MVRIFAVVLMLHLISPALLYSGNQSFEQDSIRARKLYTKARALAEKNLYKEAIDSFELSLKIREKLFGEDHYYAAVTKNAIGINYKNLGQSDQALGYFQEAERIYRSHGEKYLIPIANVYNGMATVYETKLDFNTTLEYLQRSADIYINQKGKNNSTLSAILYNMADLYIKIELFDEALEIIREYYDSVEADNKLLFLELQSVIFQLQNDVKNATESYEKTISLAVELYGENDIIVAFELLNYSTFLIEIEKLKQAEKTLEQAYSIIKQTQPKKGAQLSDYYYIKGALFTNKNVESREIESFKKQKSRNIKNAIEYYFKGLTALNVNLSKTADSTIDISGSLSFVRSLDFFKSIADTYVQLADIYSQEEIEFESNLSHAIDYYKITSQLIQQTRKEISSDESKIQLTELEQATFQKMIQAAYMAYDLNQRQEIIDFAFQSAEHIKASSVFDRLSNEFAKNNLIDDSLIQRENILNSSITRYQENLYYLENDESPNPEEVETTKNQLFELKKQRNELNEYLEENYPNYYELKYSDKLLGINEIQKKLKNNEVLIEYTLNENDSIPKLYAFLITKNELQFIQPKIDSKFIQAVQSTFQFMSNPRYMFTKNEDSKQFCVSSNLLYLKLIMPFKNQIRDKKILIIPDGKLNYVAFDALIEELPDTSSSINFADLKYLIRKNTINYSYSANLLYRFKESKASVNNDVLAFAPDYSSTDTIEFNNTRMALMPLPGIIEEVDIISREIKKTKKFVEDEATEINFREHSEEFDILHLAMHAFIDDSNPAFSRLAFTQNGVKNGSNENNGWLNTADIYNLNLNARLTVLSACNTGSGALRKGEGVMSLARGFLYAGCPSIVMTLWEVDDRAGTEIMGSFYKKLKKGRSIDESLRMAKLEYLNSANPRTAHPHFWLGYVSIGDSSPLFRSYDYYFFGLLIIALIAVTIDQLVRAGKSRKKRTE